MAARRSLPILVRASTASNATWSPSLGRDSLRSSPARPLTLATIERVLDKLVAAVGGHGGAAGPRQVSVVCRGHRGEQRILGGLMGRGVLHDLVEIGQRQVAGDGRGVERSGPALHAQPGRSALPATLEVYAGLADCACSSPGLQAPTKFHR